MKVETGQIAQAAAILRRGGLVAFPTETVYGLGANALDAAAVRRIFEVKQRPATSPLIVHAASERMARDYALDWPASARDLARRFWPGPLTLVVPKKPVIPDIVTAGLGTVGLRVPAHPVAVALIRAAGVPVAAPSANRFTQLSPTSAEHVRASLGDAVDLILDGGSTPVGIESTVLSLAGRPTLLRPGMISKEELEVVIGDVAVAPAAGAQAFLEDAADLAHAAPGMHRKHYSPRTPLLLIAPGERPVGGRGAVVSHRSHAHGVVRMSADPRRYAAALYATLHELDGQGYDWIAVERVPELDAWAGIRDRLTRAAARE
ncbi:MAG: L-threonylcarbamoyladenylate synthase [Bryobacteraceae bacterium]|jgi:L-threonylcarbamoyladenylate synthase